MREVHFCGLLPQVVLYLRVPSLSTLLAWRCGLPLSLPLFDNDAGEGDTLPRALNECLNTLCRVGISAVDQDSCWFPDSLLSVGSSRQPEH